MDHLIRPWRAVAAALAAALALGLAACGSEAAVPQGGVTTPLATATTLTVAPAAAGPTPSASAQLACARMTQVDMAYTLGETPLAPVQPTWVDHLYACDYRYRDGSIALSVKELSSAAQTTAYYRALARQFGDTGSIAHLGQGAYTTTNGSVVVRKDWRVLLVDVAKLPAEFGSPETSREDVAITVADVVIACWTGN